MGFLSNKFNSIKERKVTDALGSYLGSIDSSGRVRNFCTSCTGTKIDSNGFIRNNAGNVIGSIDNAGWIRNASGNPIGSIDEDGRIKDTAGTIKYTIRY